MRRKPLFHKRLKNKHSFFLPLWFYVVSYAHMNDKQPTPDKQPEDRVVSIRLNDELIAGADKIAEATERTRVQVIRLALKTFISAQA